MEHSGQKVWPHTIVTGTSELEYGLQPGNFDAVVVNDDLETAVVEFDRAVRRLYSNDGLA